MEWLAEPNIQNETRTTITQVIPRSLVFALRPQTITLTYVFEATIDPLEFNSFIKY